MGLRAQGSRGFTLIELIVVMAIVALLVSIAAPRYFLSVENARDQSLRTSLRVMRDAIDQFQADKGRYPQSLEELTDNRYLREIPEDPITGRRDSWVAAETAPEVNARQGGMADVKSGATALDRDGKPYSDW
jgi:type II secretion system protein G